MSDNNIPFEIQTEILKTLPVKSLLRFRSVSKTWKCLIDSSDFIFQYNDLKPQAHHLFVSYYSDYNVELNYVSIVDDDDDDTFPQRKVSLRLPRSVNYYDLIGSSHGLLCFHGKYCHNNFPATDMVVLWNISIRKGVSVVVPNVELFGMYTIALGFGVCRVTSDLKIVKVRYKSAMNDVESISCIPWQVEVFTLSTRAWRSSYSNPPRDSIHFHSLYVASDGFVYWLAYDRIATDDGYCNLIISFDMTTEEFKEVNLPDSLAQQPLHNLSLSKLRESVVVLERGVHGNTSVFGVWMMEDGVSNSFSMLFNVSVNTRSASMKGFRKSGEPIIEISEQEYDRAQLALYDPYLIMPKFHGARLVVYEPCSKRLDNLGVVGIETLFLVYPYVETLLLLDQPDLTDNI